MATPFNSEIQPPDTWRVTILREKDTLTRLLRANEKKLKDVFFRINSFDHSPLHRAYREWRGGLSGATESYLERRRQRTTRRARYMDRQAATAEMSAFLLTQPEYSDDEKAALDALRIELTFLSKKDASLLREIAIMEGLLAG